MNMFYSCGLSCESFKTPAVFKESPHKIIAFLAYLSPLSSLILLMALTAQTTRQGKHCMDWAVYRYYSTSKIEGKTENNCPNPFTRRLSLFVLQSNHTVASNPLPLVGKRRLVRIYSSASKMGSVMF